MSSWECNFGHVLFMRKRIGHSLKRDKSPLLTPNFAIGRVKDIEYRDQSLKRFICLVEVNNNTVNYTQTVKMFMLVKFSSPTR